MSANNDPVSFREISAIWRRNGRYAMAMHRLLVSHDGKITPFFKVLRKRHAKMIIGSLVLKTARCRRSI